MPATLSDFITPRPRYARSIHLERDEAAFSYAPTEADNGAQFYFTTSIREALGALALGLKTPSERALTLIGPYGAGKSAFAVFLTDLLQKSRAAHEFLRAHDADLANQFAGKPLFLVVRLVGARAPLAPALLRALQNALAQAAPNFNARFRDVAPDPRAVADAFGEAARLVCQNGLGGVLVIVDELGKFLEFAAIHPQQSDVFVLQELAESAARSGDAPLLVLGMLHQNPGAYAHKLSRARQTDWEKVAQRFRQITLFPSDVERMDMVGRALQQTGEWDLNGAFAPAIAACAPFAPAGLGARFESLARAAFPLHPLTLLALPTLFARSGQSHRSLFNFVCGEERAALAPFLRQQQFEPDNPALFTLDLLFDYAREVLSSGTIQSHSWQDAVESVERVGARENTPLELAVIKTVALLSWLRDPRLPASREVLRAAFAGHDLDATLAELEAEKRIVWSRARNRYRLLEIGDVDIEAELKLARGALSGDVTMGAATGEMCPFPVLNARRHSFQTGAIRNLPILVVRPRDAATAAHKADGELAVLLILAENEAERDEAQAFVANYKAPNLLFALALESDDLREAAAQSAACAVVAQTASELQSDRAARRELEGRAAEARTLFGGEVARLFAPLLGESPTDGSALWLHAGAIIPLDAPRRFSAFLSAMADATYHAAPILRNELLNRRNLSSAGASARRALLTAMLERADQKRLGLVGFPPERSIYQCALQATQLHVETPDGWRFQAPPARHATRLRPAWDALAAQIFAEPPREVPISELAEMLRRPPFGVTAGVFPVLLAALLRVHADEITLYENGAFKPEIGAADWEMLTRRPDKWSVAGCRVAGARRAVVARLGASLGETAAALPIVRRILKMTRALPEFAWKTRDLPSEVLALRDAIERARSPEKFLFEQVPLALGLLPLGESEDETQVEAFFAALNSALAQWSAVTSLAIGKARAQLLAACEVPDGETGWRQLRAQAARWNGKTVHPLLSPLFARLCEPDAVAALEGTLALIAHRPAKSWGDADAEKFADLAAPYGEALSQLRQQRESLKPARPTDLSASDQIAVKQLVKRLSKSQDVLR